MVKWQLVHLCTDTVKLLSFFNIIWNISCFSNSYPTWWSSTQQFPSWHLFSSEPRKTSSTVWTKQSGRVQTFTALPWWRRLCSFTERHWARWGWWENRRNEGGFIISCYHIISQWIFILLVPQILPDIVSVVSNWQSHSKEKEDAVKTMGTEQKQSEEHSNNQIVNALV